MSTAEEATAEAVRLRVAHELAKLPKPGDDIENARVRQRGDYYADCAVGAMIHANQQADTAKAQNGLRAAQVYASLSLRDSIQECTATLKEVAMQEIEASAELSQTVKKATNATVAELRKATVRAA